MGHNTGSNYKLKNHHMNREDILVLSINYNNLKEQ